MYEMRIGGVLFPVTPGKISYRINSKNETITLINGGEVNIIRTPGLTEITVDELLLPVQRYPFARYDGRFYHARWYVEKIEKWKNSKKPVKLKITRSSPNGKQQLRETNFDVTIEDYEIIEDAKEQGPDVVVKLQMKQYRKWGAKKLKIEKDTGNLTAGKKGSKNKNSSSRQKATTKTARKAKDTPGSYVVKKGDCLMFIARKQLNDSTRWREIYGLNQKTIEAEAKKRGRKSSSNGHWIYPGTKLKLPE